MTTPSEALFRAPEDSVILVVDDIATNIQVAASVLDTAGYEVMPATSGRQALERVRKQLPDLILLDMMMPEMSGVEVCQSLKKEAATSQIPVIFLTASNEMEHLVQAFEAGAVDYVTKPFSSVELLARVKTHLELKAARDALAKYGEELTQLNEEKNEFLGIAAHDLRSPLSNIMSSANLMLYDRTMDRGQLDEFLQIIYNSAQHMAHLVENLLDVNAIERGKLKLELHPCDVAALAQSVAVNYAGKAYAKSQTINFELPASPMVAMADHHTTLQVFDNLLSNAIKYSPIGKHIWLELKEAGDRIVLTVQDEGPGFSEDDKERLFGKFARLSAQPTGGESSTGLGLSIVKRMVEAGGGKVSVESVLGSGATFIVDLPKAPEGALAAPIPA